MEKKDFYVWYFNNLFLFVEFVIIEDGNVFVVFKGCIRSWFVYNFWNFCKGGL